MAIGNLIIANLTLGLLSSFSPCLFPLLPSYLATQVKMKQSKMISILSSLALVAGIVIVFFGIGLLSNLIGDFLILNYAFFARFQAVLLIIAGLILIASPSFMYNIKLPEWIENYIYSEDNQKNSIVFSFLLGLVYTIIAAPCAGGFFIAVWVNLLGQTAMNQLVLVLFFAIGAGLPFLMIGLFADEIRGETIGKIHAASSRISKILGSIFILVGIYIFYDVGIFNK